MDDADRSPISHYAAEVAPLIDRAHEAFHRQAAAAFRQSGLDRPQHAGILISLRFALADPSRQRDRPLRLSVVKLAFRYSAPDAVATAVAELATANWLHTDGDLVRPTQRTVDWTNSLYDLHAQVATTFWQPAPADLTTLAALANRLLTATSATPNTAPTPPATDTANPTAATAHATGTAEDADVAAAAATQAAGAASTSATDSAATSAVAGPVTNAGTAGAATTGATDAATTSAIGAATTTSAADGPATNVATGGDGGAAANRTAAAAGDIAAARVAETGGGGVFVALGLPYERAGDPPGLVLFNRLAVLRYHRADAHAAAWAAEGLTAQEMQALHSGELRERIEAETNRLAAQPYAALTEAERQAFLAGLAALSAAP
ncbi:hypothetical protein [Flindersiella endophytica]